jgi:uncharacterized protein
MARKKAAAVAEKAPKPLYKDYGQLLHAMWHDPSVLQQHLHASFGINTPDPRGYTLLYLACDQDAEALTKGSDTLVKQLLQAGADPNCRTRDGFTPLMVANSPSMANCLLDHGADIEREANDGSSVLEQACHGGASAVVKILLERGASGQILKGNDSGHTPLSVAVNKGYGDLTLLLLQHLVLQPGFDINHPRLTTNQPLLCCTAAGGLCRVAEFALDHGADPDITGPNGPPLFLAVRNAPVSMVSCCVRRALMCRHALALQTALIKLFCAVTPRWSKL